MVWGATILIGLFSFGKKNGTGALSQRKSTAEQLPFAQLCAGLCRLAQRLRLRASTDTISSTGGAHGASDRPKRARAGQPAQRLDEDVRDGTQPKMGDGRCIGFHRPCREVGTPLAIIVCVHYSLCCGARAEVHVT